MTDIQRYKLLSGQIRETGEYLPHNCYVKYDDHKARVQELELKQNYKLLDEIIILRHRLKELEASNKRKRAKIKSMEQSKFVNHLKADAIEEMGLEAERQYKRSVAGKATSQEIKPTMVSTDWMYDYSAKLREVDDE